MAFPVDAAMLVRGVDGAGADAGGWARFQGESSDSWYRLNGLSGKAPIYATSVPVAS